MADQTSTLSIEVRTGQAAAELNKLMIGLAEVAAAADALNKVPAVGAATTKALPAATQAVNQYTTAMGVLEKSSTSAAAMQMRFSRSMGQVRAAAKLSQDATLAQVRDFNTKLDATEFAAEARRVEQMRGAQSSYMRLVAERQKIQDAGSARRQATNNRQLALTKAYFEKDISQRIAYMARVERVMQSGALSNSQLARAYGVTALREMASGASAGYAGTLAAGRGAATTEAAASAHKKLGTAARGGADVLRGHTAAMRDAHGVARGLSGSLGTLWMTYGAIAPLLAGAALGSMAKSTMQVGKDLEYRLKFLEALGNAPVSTGQMMPAVLGSMKTPLEAAEAMQALAQAGLTSKQSLEALNTVMQLSTLGELGMEQAAVTVTAALAAFNLETTEAGRVGDVFAKAAAVSNTSVEKITESMKQASTSAAQYNISIEETSAALAVMAQRNITGTMAGTSFRNMTKELYTPIARGAKTMDQLGLSAYDAAGRMKPFQDVLRDLRESLYGLDEQSKNSALEAIFGERGSRAIKPILEDLENYLGKVKEMESAQGFLVIANSKLIDTVEGASNRLASTVQQTYAKSFDNIRDSVRDLLAQIDQIAASDGFTNFVTWLATTFIELTQSVMRSKDALLTLGSVYAAFKAGTLGLSIATSALNVVKKAAAASTTAETLAVKANTAAQMENTAAQLTNNAAKLGPVRGVINSMGGLVGVATKLTSVVGWAALGYTALSAAYDIVTEKSSKLVDQQNKELRSIEAVAGALKKEADTKDGANAARMGGITAEDARTEQERLRARTAAEVLNAQSRSEIAELSLTQAAEALRLEKEKYKVLGDQGQHVTEFSAQQSTILVKQGEYNQAASHALAMAGELVRAKEAEVTAQESLNRLVAAQHLTTKLGARDSETSKWQAQVQALKEDHAVVAATKDEAVRKKALARIRIREGAGISVDRDYKAEAIPVLQAGLDGHAQKLREDYVRLQEQLATTEVSASFAAPARTAKAPKDYNDPNYILERANAKAQKQDLQTVGDLKKAAVEITRMQEKAELALAEKYLTDDVIAGIRAREAAEEKYNSVLDKRRAMVEELEEALKKATDPKQIATARERIEEGNRDIEGILREQQTAGAAAYVKGLNDYIEDNTASKGVEALFTKYRNEALKTGDVIANALDSTFTKMGDALGNFVATGKLNFRELTVSILQDLAKMAMQAAMNPLFGMLIKMGTSAISGMFGPTNDIAGAIAGSNAQSFPVSAFAKGGAFSAGSMMKVVANAKGNPYTNGIVSQPTLAPMALFGEVPGESEAIMPLTRTSSGHLGVRAVPIGAEGGGGNVFQVSTVVNVSSDGGAKSETSSNNNLIDSFGRELSSMIKAQIERSLGQGGAINRAIKGA